MCGNEIPKKPDSEPAETEPEIEITPEMIEAGTEVVAGYDPESENLADLVREAYLAMTSVRLGSAKNDS